MMVSAADPTQIRDATVATAHGLPLVIRYSEFDVPPLTAEDFIEEEGAFSAISQTYAYSVDEISFYIHHARLSELLGAVHTENYCNNRINRAMAGSITSREAFLALEEGQGTHMSTPKLSSDEHGRYAAAWYANVPPELQYNVDDIQEHRFWPAYLHILFLSVNSRVLVQCLEL